MSRPLYQTVIDAVIGRIASGELGPGAMLPSEPQLAAALGVSPGTARKAMGALEARGLINRVQGRGSFVAVSTPETALFSFFRLRAPDGGQVTPQLLREAVRQRPATPEEAATLDGAPAEVVEIVRLRALDGRAAALETSVVSAARFPGLAAQAPLPNTLYVHYQRAHACVIVRAEESLQAVAADADAADALALPRGAPLLRSCRRAYDLLDRVVELRLSLYRTGPHDYRVALR